MDVLSLIGSTVVVNYVADPSFGHGQFRLENRGVVAVTAAVAAGWLELGDRQEPLARVTVFDLDQDRMVDPSSFSVEAGATMSFLLGFPERVYEPRFGESVAVGLRLGANGVELQARSRIEYVRRIRKDS